MNAGEVTITWGGVTFTGVIDEPGSACAECGEDMVDVGVMAKELGDDRPELLGRFVCRAVVAYAAELGRRGDVRPVTHQLMREDGERWRRAHAAPPRLLTATGDQLDLVAASVMRKVPRLAARAGRTDDVYRAAVVRYLKGKLRAYVVYLRRRPDVTGQSPSLREIAAMVVDHVDGETDADLCRRVIAALEKP